MVDPAPYNDGGAQVGNSDRDSLGFDRSLSTPSAGPAIIEAEVRAVREEYADEEAAAAEIAAADSDGRADHSVP